jgi:hypothetical protein
MHQLVLSEKIKETPFKNNKCNLLPGYFFLSIPHELWDRGGLLPA